MNANAFGKVGVLLGGSSSEREVSLMSGAGVLEALRSKGVNAHAFDTGLRNIVELPGEKFDRVFIALHGRFGEDGTLQGALELMQIPYTGSGVMASALAMDKTTTKRIWLNHGLPTPRFAVLDASSDLRRVPDDLGLPLMLKAPHEGSTIGIVKVAGYSDMRTGFAECSKYDDTLLAEEFITGRELTIAILGKGAMARALPIVEIKAPDGNYDFQNKYYTDVVKYDAPAVLDAVLTQRIQSIALQAYKAIDCEGWARVDVMLRASDKEPFLLEINTSPGMTSHSLVPMAARAAGMSYPDLCMEILASACLKTAGGKR
jgi:D-alanine-D-alanine ligase